VTSPALAPAAARKHSFRWASAPGFGRWRECKVCGATAHGGFFWLGGFKSKVEPPCCYGFGAPEVRAWKAEAQAVEDSIQR